MKKPSQEGTKHATERMPLWLLDPAAVREQLLVLAAGNRQYAFPTGAVEGVSERGQIHPVPALNPALLGAVAYQGALVPLLTADKLVPVKPQGGGAKHIAPEEELFDPELLAGPLLLVLREGTDLLGLAFERFLGFHTPAELSSPPPQNRAGWVKATGTIDEIPVFVVDTPALFEYCRGRSS